MRWYAKGVALLSLVGALGGSPFLRAQERVSLQNIPFSTSPPPSRQFIVKAPQKNLPSSLFLQRFDQRYRDQEGYLFSLREDSESSTREVVSLVKDVARDYARGLDAYERGRGIFEERLEDLKELVDQASQSLMGRPIFEKKRLGIDIDTRKERPGEELFDPWSEREHFYRTKLGIGMHPNLTFSSGNLHLKAYADEARLEFVHLPLHRLVLKLGTNVRYDEGDLPHWYVHLTRPGKYGEWGLGVRQGERGELQASTFFFAKF